MSLSNFSKHFIYCNNLKKIYKMQKSPLENKHKGKNSDITKYGMKIQKLNAEIIDSTAATLLWKYILNTVHASIIPVVNAAPPEKPPSKPPKMKYKDLPIYQSPHYEYKDYIADKEKCPDHNEKLLHNKLYPIVHRYRTGLAESMCGMKNEICLISKEIYEAICERTKCMKKYMRDPENLSVRRSTVAASTLTGFYIGSGTRGFGKKLFFSTLGALAGGALCFPKETDEVFRNFSYNFGKCMIYLFNTACRQNYSLRERLPCPDDLPPPSPPLPPNKTNKKCYDKK